LIACEYSGAVRDAFIRAGHDAMSCDLQPTEAPGPHYHGDVRDVLSDRWDMLIAHPTCTYMTNSGVRWLHTDASRWPKLFDGAAFFRLFDRAHHIPMRAVENPIPHKYALQLIGRKYDQLIQPWMFGHGETKATCLWLHGLPRLQPTKIVDGRDPRIHRLSPSADRWKERSRTYSGIAEAMAEQWGRDLIALAA
jgi:hypothetical protein